MSGQELYEGVIVKLKNKVAIITGSASGIGKATALLFAKEGARIVIADIGEKGRKVVEEINKNGKAIFVKCDVSKSNDVKNLINKTIKEFNSLDILINNAGIYLCKTIEEMSEEEWNRIININLKGVFLCSKYAIPHMKKSKGVIVNNASTLGLKAEPESPAYCASKAGIVNLTRSMAMEYAKYGIRINCVCPGPIDTPLFRNAFRNNKELKTYVNEHTIMKRPGKPEEVANVVLFLASNDSSYVIGSCYSVDGGEAL